MIEMETDYNSLNEDSMHDPPRKLRAGVAADSIFFYLGIFVDDIGDVILYAYEDKDTLDSFNKLKTQSNNPSWKYSIISDLFNELDKTGSWFELGFKRGVGVRQRITHYDSIINFGAGRNGSSDPWKAFATIWGPGSVATPGYTTDIVQIIRQLFLSLFDWLEQLYDRLSSIMRARNLVAEAEWERPWMLGRFPVSTFMPTNPATLPDDDYLYLPLCEGSDPFSW